MGEHVTKSAIKSMTKKELTEAVAERLGVKKIEGVRVVEAVLDIIEQTTASGRPVNVKNFGKFELNHKPPREGRIPSSGEVVPFEETWTPRFTPGAGFIGLARQTQKNKQ
ncbi:HU family DNA-binding protein [Streptosporangium sp. OZ121]|uniref:HU family DNA-binding protein n=1 Tax=Streptosporangium sp. OZ121 TaxID=3444183 RepID=UPI003F79913D